MSAFKDHFSGHAADYARYRPGYPPALFDWLAARAPSRRLALDCGTGSGQAAGALARRFEHVIATDASAEQIANAERFANVEYRVARAEAVVADNGAVDLVTVAQALHWFDVEAFYATAEAALAPGGVLAVWTYELMQVNREIDALIDDVYRGELDVFWPPERALVETGYRGILPRWPRIATPAFTVRMDWTVDDALGYLSSWSAVQRYRRALGRDPLAALAGPLRAAWGSRRRGVLWPVVLHAFRRPWRAQSGAS